MPDHPHLADLPDFNIVPPSTTRENTRRHKHHHSTGHGKRFHYRHHHHHRCCDRQQGHSCPDHGPAEEDSEGGPRTPQQTQPAPHSATFGTFPSRDGFARRESADGDGVPLTAPLPRNDPADHQSSTSVRRRAGSNSRNLLSVESSNERMTTSTTPAPSYHSESTPERAGRGENPSDGITSHIVEAYHVSEAPLDDPRAHVHFTRSQDERTNAKIALDAANAAAAAAAATTRNVQERAENVNKRSSRSARDSLGDLQHRDRRLSLMLDDVVRDPTQSVADQTLRKRNKSKRASMIDSVMGLDDITPGDLIYGEGSKIDGGFGFAVNSMARESTILLDSRPDMYAGRPATATERSTNSRFSTDSISTVSSRLSNMFGRFSHRGSAMQHRNSSRSSSFVSTDSMSSDADAFGRFQQRQTMTSLSDRVNNGNLRPSHLDLDRNGARGGRHPSNRGPVRRMSSISESDVTTTNGTSTSAWEDVHLGSGNRNRESSDSSGKNDRLAESLGVRRAVPKRRNTAETRNSTGSDLTVINEEEDYYDDDDGQSYNGEKHANNRFTHGGGGGDRNSSNYEYEKETYNAMNLPPGLSQADVVAICLVQGMVPPGLPPDDTLVTWSGPLSPTNPRNWSTFTKWYACILISWSTFLANAATNMIAPALGLMSETYKELYIMAIRGMLIGAYIFAFTFAPLIFGPMSEIVGRKPVLIVGALTFTSASMMSGMVTATWQLMMLRFVAAFGASAPMSIGGAVITDIFAPDQRGRAMTLYALAPQLGPVLGPMMGGWVTQEANNWRLIFYISAACGFTAAIPMLFIRESYTPRILANRAHRLRKESGNQQLSTIFERRQESKRQIMTRGVVRPLVLFSCEPIVQLLCLYVSLIYGIIHLVVATFPAVFGTIYSEYPGWASMHFITIGVGTITGGFIGGYLVERHYHHKSITNRGVAKPEFKFYCMLYTVWIPPLGLMIYGFMTYYGIHWIFADFGIVVFCIGISIAVVAIQSYMVDCYALLAGSALTSTIVFRSIVGTGATIGAEDLLLHAGMLWSNVALASACILIGVPAAYIVYFWGPAMRQRSRHATHKR